MPDVLMQYCVVVLWNHTRQAIRQGDNTWKPLNLPRSTALVNCVQALLMERR